MVKVRQMLVSEEKWNLKCPYTMTAEFITIHNTANDASADDEVSYMISNNNEVSFHYAVDDVEVVQGILTNRNAWHCGDGGNGTGNRKSIGIETCYSKSGGEKYTKSEENTVQLAAQLLKERGWGTDKVKQHSYWSGKNCPHRIREEGTWQSFLDRVNKALGNESSTPPSAPPVESNSGETAPIPTLKKGSRGNEVEKLQKYIHAKSDGDFGSNTDTALRNWQKIYGLTIDGIYGSKSQAMMQDVIDGEAKRVYVPTVPTPTLEVGSSGQEVKELQVIINAKVDGDFGPKTEQTLMNWQKVYDLESDGVYGQLTEAKMHEVY